ncbi:MAG TPA: phosphatase PAP2 family protein [Parachlamydiaceae bacterium]|nr:phosphatase PAP2 family protein [Parachlamydiaceae bacterium]
MNRNNLLWFLPILLMVLIAPFTPWLDLEITKQFYHPENPAFERFSTGAFFDFLFNYGIMPGWIAFIASTLFFLLSYISKKFENFRSPCLILILTLIVGAGFLTHFVLKDHWGRPRPKQTIEFGGTQEFHPFYSPNFFNDKEPAKSFPCGHCSMGFYFFALAVIGMRLKKKWMINLGFSLAFFLGILLGVVRIMQGGHYFSDVLFSCLLMWLTALSMDYLVYQSSLKS